MLNEVVIKQPKRMEIIHALQLLSVPRTKLNFDKHAFSVLHTCEFAIYQAKPNKLKLEEEGGRKGERGSEKESEREKPKQTDI